MRVGFIGLGKMGRPMARNVLRAGFETIVHNRSRAAVDDLVKDGAKAASSPVEVASFADVVLTSLPDVAAVKMVYLGQSGLLDAEPRGQVLVDLSTVDPATSRHIADAASARGEAFLDAPVSGGTVGAEAGTLTIMVGGDVEALGAVRPVLDVLGTRIHHVGSSGMGSVIKLVNQLLVAINVAGVVEALVLGTRAGADPQTMLDVLESSFGNSAMLRRCGELIIDRRFEAGTPIKILLKDLGLIDTMGNEARVRLLMGSIARAVFAEAKALELTELDIAALVLPLEQICSVEVRRNVSAQLDS